MPSNLDALLDLAVGLLISTEHGWSARDIDDSHLRPAAGGQLHRRLASKA